MYYECLRVPGSRRNTAGSAHRSRLDTTAHSPETSFHRRRTISEERQQERRRKGFGHSSLRCGPCLRSSNLSCSRPERQFLEGRCHDMRRTCYIASHRSRRSRGCTPSLSYADKSCVSHLTRLSARGELSRCPTQWGSLSDRWIRCIVGEFFGPHSRVPHTSRSLRCVGAVTVTL